MAKNSYFTDAEYLAALVRMRALIANGATFRAYDDTTPGNKSTECTWGLCSEQKAMWPEPAMHLWPRQFSEEGRIAPKYFKRDHFCAFDTKEGNLDNGCFYRCRIFQEGKKPARVLALELFDKRISEVKGDTPTP